MTSPDPRLAVLLHERFRCSPWWTTSPYEDQSTSDVLGQIVERRRALRDAAETYGDDLTSLLPDQDVA